MDGYQIWAYLATALAAIFVYLNARKPQINDLMVEVLKAARDEKVTDEEFQKIVDKVLKVVRYTP